MATGRQGRAGRNNAMINKDELNKLMLEMMTNIPHDIMFLAYCYTCDDVSTFQYGKCLECKEIWKPLMGINER